MSVVVSSKCARCCVYTGCRVTFCCKTKRSSASAGRRGRVVGWHLVFFAACVLSHPPRRRINGSLTRWRETGPRTHHRTLRTHHQHSGGIGSGGGRRLPAESSAHTACLVCTKQRGDPVRPHNTAAAPTTTITTAAEHVMRREGGRDCTFFCTRRVWRTRAPLSCRPATARRRRS